MIFQRPDGTYLFTSVSGATMGQRVVSVTMTAVDIEHMLGMDPEYLQDWLRSSLLTRFVPSKLEKEHALQVQEVQRQNRLLKGSEAIDDFRPAQFATPPEQLG